MIKKQLAILRDEMKSELYEDIIPFWTRENIKDDGGFWTTINNELTERTDSPKSLINFTRLLWTYSAWYRFDKNEIFATLAAKAFECLQTQFWDREYKGAFWSLDDQGKVIDDKKRIYGHSFFIYSMCEYYMAVGDANALAMAKETFDVIESESFDKEYAGYFETYNRDWSEPDDVRLSDKDMNEKKSMNTHLHILEAYTNLYRVWPDEKLKASLKELINLFITYIIDKDEHRFKLFFDETWNCKSPYTSFGHDIEGSWLLWEAAEVLGDKELLATLKPIAIEMARQVMKNGFDKDNGLFYESKGSEIVDTDKHWWPQAESIVGFINAWQLSGDKEFVAVAINSWEFTKKYIIDHKHGEWFWKVNKEGIPDLEQPKVTDWKGPYHNSRACMEIMTRLSNK